MNNLTFKQITDELELNNFDFICITTKNFKWDEYTFINNKDGSFGKIGLRPFEINQVKQNSIENALKYGYKKGFKFDNIKYKKNIDGNKLLINLEI